MNNYLSLLSSAACDSPDTKACAEVRNLHSEAPQIRLVHKEHVPRFHSSCHRANGRVKQRKFRHQQRHLIACALSAQHCQLSMVDQLQSTGRP